MASLVEHESLILLFMAIEIVNAYLIFNFVIQEDCHLFLLIVLTQNVTVKHETEFYIRMRKKMRYAIFSIGP